MYNIAFTIQSWQPSLQHLHPQYRKCGFWHIRFLIQSWPQWLQHPDSFKTHSQIASPSLLYTRKSKAIWRREAESPGSNDNELARSQDAAFTMASIVVAPGGEGVHVYLIHDVIHPHVLTVMQDKADNMKASQKHFLKCILLKTVLPIIVSVL